MPGLGRFFAVNVLADGPRISPTAPARRGVAVRMIRLTWPEVEKYGPALPGISVLPMCQPRLRPIVDPSRTC
jgi:hypothetical protein